MASLKELVEQYGFPCPVKCITHSVYPFTILQELNNKYLIYYDRITQYHLVDKENPQTNDYEYDGN